MRDIAIVSFAQRCNQPEWREGNDIELLIDPINEALGRVGMTRQDVIDTFLAWAANNEDLLDVTAPLDGLMQAAHQVWPCENS